MSLNFMLIDDNGIDLFVNQKFIEKVVDQAEIIAFIRATKAIDFLRTLKDRPVSDFPFIPDFILLDINMPEMDGFDFLNEYCTLEKGLFDKTKIYMISSSTSLKDRIDADRHSACDGFISKPLFREKVLRILNGAGPVQKQYQL